MNSNNQTYGTQSVVAFLVKASLLILCFSPCGCLSKHDPPQFYGIAKTPQSRELRWSDGGLPRVFDPALASAPPDTDAIRALFEGLTDLDRSASTAVPAIATDWRSSPDGRVWTFQLRRDAKWSNGEPVTAQDFVRSWKRVLNMGDRSPSAKLLANVKGVAPEVNPAPSPTLLTGNSGQAPVTPNSQSPQQGHSITTKPAESERPLGIAALDDYTFEVRLEHPDKDFPNLAAHPGLRPVHVSDSASGPSAATVSNGPFALAATGQNSVVLSRSDLYWNASETQLEKVRFVGYSDSESALAAYKSGEVDAVTNAALEPLAVKLLTPYKDFRRTTYAALTMYSFNQNRAPFNDVRVREALTIAIDRNRLSQDTMGGSTIAADRFLPNPGDTNAVTRSANNDEVQTNLARARDLLAQAGYPDGNGFPRVNLVINRNDQQKAVAQAVATMWKAGLKIETDIVSKTWEEYEAAIQGEQYDVVRRSVVMPAPDEGLILSMIFESVPEPASEIVSPQSATSYLSKKGNAQPTSDGSTRRPEQQEAAITEADALRNFAAIPLFFASSYSLVKPYVTGFDPNLQDAPSLKSVKIDTGWLDPPVTKTFFLK